jgi:hypothetical protein
MQLNRHHPLDVLTGAVLGGFVGLCFAGALPGRCCRLRRRKKNPRAAALKILLIAFSFVTVSASAATTNLVTISITPKPVNVFTPWTALGAGVDAIDTNIEAQVYSPSNLVQMLAAGHGPLTYRLNTELGVQDWHWNPNGTWSDTNDGGQGYFTGSADTNAALIMDSSPYGLPHRGFTTDPQDTEAAYSRLTDGDTNTYWKSNPYLAAAFTGEPDTAHPQWVVLDLGAAKPVNAIRILWVNPFATAYQVQFWVPDDTGGDPINDPTNGAWQTFPAGVVTNNPGGNVTNLLASAATNVEFLRVLMTASSGTCDTHGTNDVRNSLGYAIAEIYAGTNNPANGRFTDVVKHSTTAASQTTTYVSSVDPWHSVTNQIPDIDQPGLDFIFTNGITRGLPVLVPVPMLYSTPSNAVAEIQYLEARGYPIAGVELGEEPDGQYVAPEDYGSLYLQWASALHAFDPALKLGGPVFQGTTNDVVTWPDINGQGSWLTRFLNYLSAHGRLADLSFMSFEHYPFAPCDNVWVDLPMEPGIAQNMVATWRADGLPANVPVYVTEYNFSSDFAADIDALGGALWQADFVGSFLTAGGAGAFYYEYEPLPLVQAKTCATVGSFGMFTVDSNYQVLAYTSQFYGAQLINQTWAQSNNQPHYVFAAHSDLLNTAQQELITAYALLRPDGQWALLLINKDNVGEHYVRIQFSNTVSGAVAPWLGPTDFYHFSTNYVWHGNGLAGYPSPDLPPTYALVTNSPNPVFLLPEGSLDVVRGPGLPLLGLNAFISVTNNDLVLDYLRSNTGKVSYLAQVSTNLTDWLTDSLSVTQTLVMSNTLSSWMEARDLIPLTNSAQGFLQLKVQSP